MEQGLSNDRFKRVKRGSDDQFCQVKMFSEDYPSKVVSKAEDYVPENVALYHSSEMKINNSSRSFGSKEHSSRSKPICVPHIEWKCPPVFLLKTEWQVVAGEESEERMTQNYRETRDLVALYSNVSAIPPSPRISPESENCDYDDTETPIIPLKPIEEEALPIESASCSESIEESNLQIDSKSTVDDKLHEITADGIAAASAVLAAMLTSKEKGGMIDTDLLLQILNDPEMIESLSKVPVTYTTENPGHLSYTLFNSQTLQPQITSQQNAKSCTNSRNMVDSLSSSTIFGLNSSSSDFSTCLKPYSDTPSISVSRNPMYIELDQSRKVAPSSSAAILWPNASSTSPKDRSPRQESHSSLGTQVIKDVNYYKNLVRLHGMERNASQEQCTPQQYQGGAPELAAESIQSRERKACKFFQSSKGCRKGPSCPFEHVSLPIVRAGNFINSNSSKRLKKHHRNHRTNLDLDPSGLGKW